MIYITNIRRMRPDDAVCWAIVRSYKNPKAGIKQVDELSPSQELHNLTNSWIFKYHNFDQEKFDEIYVPRFIQELVQNPDALRLLDGLRDASADRNILLGCFCKNEAMCHRSIIGGILQGMGAKVKFENPFNDYDKYYKMFVQALKTACS